MSSYLDSEYVAPVDGPEHGYYGRKPLNRPPNEEFTLEGAVKHEAEVKAAAKAKPEVKAEAKSAAKSGK